MKKIISTILIFTSFINLSVSAAHIPSVTFTALENENTIKYYVDVKGDYDETSEGITALKVTDSSGNIMYMNQTEANAEGKYIIEDIILKLSGSYTAHINSSYGDQVVTAPFTLPAKSEYTDFLSVLNREASSTDDYSTAIGTDGTKFGLDLKYYNSALNARTNVLSELILKKGSYTINNLNEYILDGIITGIVKSPETAALKDEMFKYYAGTKLVINDKYSSLYESYINLSSQLKENVWQEIKGLTITDSSQVPEVLFVSLIRTVFNSFTSDKVDEFLCNNINALTINGYDDFTTTKKGMIIDKIPDKTYNTISGFTTAYIEVLGEIDSENNSGTVQTPPVYTPPAGGGGGGGNVKDYPLTTEKAEEEEKNEVVQPVIEAGFEDLDEVLWAKEAILYFKRNGIVNGKTESSFAPLDNVTRAEFCKILVNAFELLNFSETSSFADVSVNDWYYPYVTSAYSNGIINGYSDGSFKGNEAITREQMVTMLYRFMQRKSMINKIDSVTNNFSDYNNISDYAKNAVLILNNAGYVKGVGDSTFLPKKTASRAEVCLLVYNILKGAD